MTVEPIERKARRNGAADTPPTAPHVYTAIAAVMAELAKEGIGKNRTNEHQRFKFRGVDDVYNALARVLADNQLCVIPRVLSREIVERQTKQGAVLFYVTVATEFDFVSAVDGSTHRVGPFYGEAMDSGDKATNKAMSAAYKYMAFQTFCIPTEGDNDADATTHEVAPSAAGGSSPHSSPARQQQSSAAAKREDTWGRFERTLQSFRDLDELESWWADAGTQAKIDTMPAAWQEQASEAYEKRQEALLKAGAP